MSWGPGKEASKVRKFLINGIYEPEDIDHRELRLLRQYFPEDYQFIKSFLEIRHEAIESGEWTEEHEPKHRDIRIKKYEHGKGIVKPWKSRKEETSTEVGSK